MEVKSMTTKVTKYPEGTYDPRTISFVLLSVLRG